MTRPAVFLDKDGTVVVNVPYNVNPDLIEFMPGVPEALRQLRAAGFELIMISNQAGIALGYFNEAELMVAVQRLNELLLEADVHLAGFYYCPHHPSGCVPGYTQRCDCRKPSPGLLEKAAAELHIDMASSWFFGDILDDVEAGNRARCRTILIDTGTERDKPMVDLRQPEFIVENMQQAAAIVLQQQSILDANSDATCRY